LFTVHLLIFSLKTLLLKQKYKKQGEAKIMYGVRR